MKTQQHKLETMKIRLWNIFLLLFLLIGYCSPAQDVIHLNNPSFEDVPHVGGDMYNRGPDGWYDCGFPGETPPDIQPNLEPFKEPFFGVTQRATDGKTYLGMVVRDNDTYEAIGQRFEKAIEGGKKYAFNVYLSRSSTYVSLGRTEHSRGKPVNYTEPIKLRIWGGSRYCDREELLAESPLIKSSFWKDYELIFEPKENHRYIMFEAYYDELRANSYCGHILVDDCSRIVEIIEQEIVENEEPASFSLEDASPERLDSIILSEAYAGIEKKTNLPRMMSIYHQVYQFEKAVDGQGLRQFILHSESSDLTKTIRCLEALNITSSVEIFKKAIQVFKKKDRTPEELVYFDEVDDLILEKTGVENLPQKRLDFLKRHQKAFVEELTNY